MNKMIGILSLSLLLPSVINAAECVATPHRTTGTHYKPVDTHKIDVGSGLIVEGRILEAGTCQPIANAKIAHWQADKQGIYTDALRAYLFSDQQGKYRFATEWPALSVPHIHFIVSAKGYETIETQWRGNKPVENIRFDILLKTKK